MKTKLIFLAIYGILMLPQARATDTTSYLAKRNTFKMDLLAPIFVGALSFSYERALKPGRSFEQGIGIIGVGNKSSDIADWKALSGIFTRTGFKFTHRASNAEKDAGRHRLQGLYLRPDLVFLSYSYFQQQNLFGTRYEQHYKVKGAALILNGGIQLAAENGAVFDLFLGIGFGGQDAKMTSGSFLPNSLLPNDVLSNGLNEGRFAYAGSISNPGLVMQAGVKIGILFGKKKESIN